MTARAPLSVTFTTVAFAAIVLLSNTRATAQREEAVLRHGKLGATIDYGAVRVGGHSLDELPVGGAWRMGHNNASTIHTEVPLLPAEAVDAPAVPPGAYRVGLQRRSDKQIDFTCFGAGMPVGASEADVRIEGMLDDDEGPTKRLELAWEFDRKAKAKKTDGSARRSLLRVSFGPNRLVVPVTALGADTQKLRGGWMLDVFNWPANRFDANLEADRPVVIARLHRRKPASGEPDAWNLFVDGRGGAKFVPTMVAPTAQFGFGAIDAPDPEYAVDGSIAWEGGGTNAPTTGKPTEASDEEGGDAEESDGEKKADKDEDLPPLEADDFDVDRDGLKFTVTVGKRTGIVSIELPAKKS